MSPDLERNTRNQALIRLLYVAGLRVSEAIGLRWSDLQERGEAGQVTVIGKGGKQRSILLSGGTWEELNSLRDPTAAQDGFVFVTESGRAISRIEAYKIIRAAAPLHSRPRDEHGPGRHGAREYYSEGRAGCARGQIG